MEEPFIRDDITPYQLYLKTIYEFFKEEINADKESFETLLPDGYMRLQYQIDAVTQARKKLDAYNGVFISDAVGLGKTYICAMLANSFKRDTYKLFICPPVLVDYWRSFLQEFDVSRCDVESLGKLDRIIEKGTDKYSYIFIDETHRFRNSGTGSFTQLHQICRGKKVVLISGTVISIIENAKGRALKAVNVELINMYCEVGEYLSKLCAESSFGDKVIDEVADYIAETNPAIKGFNRRGLYRMRQFYETYKDDEFVTPPVTQISWTNHLLIISKSKTKEERDFYVALVAKEHYSKRELERQLDSSYYERYMLSSGKQPPELVPQTVRNSILDTYVLEFLDLPEQYSERNFRKAIIENLKNFILEFGKDFTLYRRRISCSSGRTRLLY